MRLTEIPQVISLTNQIISLVEFLNRYLKQFFNQMNVTFNEICSLKKLKLL